MNHRYCKLCQSSRCGQGMSLKLPNTLYRQMWICKNCLLTSNNAIINYNVRRGRVSIADIKQNLILECPYGCASNPPIPCAASRGHLSRSSANRLRLLDGEVVPLEIFHSGAQRGESCVFSSGSAQQIFISKARKTRKFQKLRLKRRAALAHINTQPVKLTHKVNRDSSRKIGYLI